MDAAQKACIAIIIAISMKKKCRRRRWVKNWMLKREKYTHLNLVQEMLLGDDLDDYSNYYRMSEDLFEKLLTMVSPYITKQNTHFRQAILPREKLSVTLRYLATGRSFKCLRYSSILSSGSISESIMDTCNALIYVLKDYMKVR